MSEAQPAGRRFDRRAVAAAVLIVLGAVLAPVSVLAVWTRAEVSDTDRFVTTVAPLVREPAVQTAVADRVAEAIIDSVDVRQLADQAIDALAAQVPTASLSPRLRILVGPLTSRVEGFVRDRAARLLASPQAGAAWDRVVRAAHQQLIAALSGGDDAVTVQGDMVVLDLTPLVDATRQRLVAAGFDVAGSVPQLRPTIPIADADTLLRARAAYSLLNTTALVLPWIAVLALAGGVFLRRDRRAAIMTVGLSLVAGMVVLLVGLTVTRGVVLARVPADVVPAAGATFDILDAGLRDALRTVAAIGPVLAIGAFLLGRSAGTIALRRVARAHRTALRIGAAALAAGVLVVTDTPTVRTVVTVGVVLLLVLGAVEVLGRGAAIAGQEEVDGPA